MRAVLKVLLVPLIVPVGVIVKVVTGITVKRGGVRSQATADGKLRRTVAAGVAERERVASGEAERPSDTQGLTALIPRRERRTDRERCFRSHCEAIREDIAQVRGDAADRVQVRPYRSRRYRR